jgi:hypothetical protein
VAIGGVLRPLLLHRSEGRRVDNAWVLAGVARSLVANFAGIEWVREQLVSSSVSIAVRKFLAPFGRPLGLPDWPGLNWLPRGGFLWPTG